MGGLRSSILASQEPGAAPLCSAHLTTALAPMMRRRRKARFPIFDVRPSRRLPPVECWSGVNPTHAAKSRPRVERQPPCPRATTILAGFEAAEVGVSFNVSG